MSELGPAPCSFSRLPEEAASNDPTRRCEGAKGKCRGEDLVIQTRYARDGDILETLPVNEVIDDGGLIRIHGAGLLTEEEARRHFEDLSPIIARHRRVDRRVKVLIDLRQAATQSAATAEVIMQATNRLYSDPADRVAIVVASTLLKLQVERVHRRLNFRVFLSVEDAEHFLAEQPNLTDA